MFSPGKMTAENYKKSISSMFGDWADEALKYYPGNTDDEARLSAEKPKANVKERTV